MNRSDEQFAAMKARMAELRKGGALTLTRPLRVHPLPQGEGRGEGAQGLGDRVHTKIGPIVHKVAPWWPCFKNRETTELKPSSLCGYIRQTLNIVKI